MAHLRFTRIALAAGVALSAFSVPAYAQDSGSASEAEGSEDGKAIIVTGSRIRQDPAKSALPLQIINPDDLTREGISSPEQLISFLASNGNGADNLASNSDVVTGAQRATNGLSSANLRGPGASSTPVLPNGRPIRGPGLSALAHECNQAP